MARKPQDTAANEAALETDNADAIADFNAGKKAGKNVPFPATFMGDPAEAEDSPQPRSINFHGTRFPLGVEVDASHLSDELKAKLVGNSHFATSQDPEGKREKMGERVRRAANAAKRARAQRVKNRDKEERAADEVESQD